uniref:Uncharacterized protein n=1 Tax=Rhipicephalus zambeziensis TaxID=60191 RepID=A0A224YKW3_9ACAR
MSDCSAWDVTPQNNSGNVKKCKKTPRKNSTAFCRRFPRVQIPLFAICRDVPSFGTRTPSWSSSPVAARRTPLNVRPSARMGFAPRCSCSPQREGSQGVRWEVKRERHDSDASLSLSGNGGRAAERRQPGAGLVARRRVRS